MTEHPASRLPRSPITGAPVRAPGSPAEARRLAGMFREARRSWGRDPTPATGRVVANLGARMGIPPDAIFGTPERIAELRREGKLPRIREPSSEPSGLSISPGLIVLGILAVGALS